MAYPTKATKKRRRRLRAFFHQQGSRSRTRIQNRLQQMQQAQLLITDPAVIEPSVLLVNTLLALVAALNHGIRQLEKAIEEVVAVHPDYSIFASFPGAGPALAPRLVAAFGSRRERYQSTQQMQSFSGIAPVMQPVGASAGSIFGGPVPNFCGRPFMSTRHCLSHTALGPKRFMKSKKAKVKLTTRGPLSGLQVDPDSVSLLAIPPAIPGTGVHGGARRPRCDRRRCRPSGPQRRLWKTSGLRVEKCRRDFEISAGWSLTDSLRSIKARSHEGVADGGERISFVGADEDTVGAPAGEGAFAGE